METGTTATIDVHDGDDVLIRMRNVEVSNDAVRGTIGRHKWGFFREDIAAVETRRIVAGDKVRVIGGDEAMVMHIDGDDVFIRYLCGAKSAHSCKVGMLTLARRPF